VVGNLSLSFLPCGRGQGAEFIVAQAVGVISFFFKNKPDGTVVSPRGFGHSFSPPPPLF